MDSVPSVRRKDPRHVGEEYLNARPFIISLATVLAMVALRVTIGWHFFQQGLAHKDNPKWASEVDGFLHQAKGPLADTFKHHLAIFHDMDRLLLAPMPAKAEKEDAVASGGEESGAEAPAKKPKPEESRVYGEWYTQVVKDWSNRVADIGSFYKFTGDQKQASQKVLDDYAAKLAGVLSGCESDIKAYRHALERNQELAGERGAEQIPNQQARLVKREAAPTGEPGASVDSTPAQWRADVESLQAAMEKGVAGLASEDQLRSGPPPTENTRLQEFATRLMWVLLVGGACVVAGLFTRTAALVLAVFLASVLASQPPWIAGTVETYSQGIEFVALLVLGTSHVGRWGGLDFFVHHILLRPFRSK
jgi:uncharacterized membrane protein YphA (DoxX/SURF4 family)